MRESEIEIGKTYLFRATSSPERQHLVGKEFTVVEIKDVWRRFQTRMPRKVKRFFNEDGVGARAEELGELDSGPADQMPF